MWRVNSSFETFFLPIQVALVQPIQFVGHVTSSFQQIVYPIWDVIFVDRGGPMVGLRLLGMGQEQHKGEGNGDRSY